MVRVRVLGRCEVEVDGAPISLRHKQAELLGLLAVRRIALPRSEVATILWPDHPESDARHNLRQTLLALRARLGGASILRDEGGALSLACPTDLEASDAAWAADEIQPQAEAPLLAGINAEWLDAARAALDRRRVESALRSGEASLPHDPARAFAFAATAIARAPDMEAPRALAIRAHLARGDRTGALREVEAFESILTDLSEGPMHSGLRVLLEPPLPLELSGIDLSLLGGAARLRLVLALLPALAHRPTAAHRALVLARNEAAGLSADERARVEATLASLALEAGDQLAAEEGARLALSLAESAPPARGFALAVWARVLFRTYRVDEALSAATEARARAAEWGDADAMLRALWVYGATLVTVHRLAEGEVALREALTLARTAADGSAIATLRHNLAIAHFYSGRVSAAAEEYEDALREAPSAFDANLRLGLGRVREAQSLWREAGEMYAQAVERLRAEERPYLLAQALTCRGDLAARRGELELARKDYAEAVALRRTIGDRLGLMTAYKGLGAVAHAAGRLRAAERDLRGALRYSLETGEPMAGASVRLALARVLADLAKHAEALTEARRARRGILGLRADAEALTDDDTLSLEAADRLINTLESQTSAEKPASLPGS